MAVGDGPDTGTAGPAGDAVLRASAVAIRGAGGSGPMLLSRVDFELHAGITALLGPNGAGKSTLLRGLAGVFPLEHGEVFLKGRRLGESDRLRLAAYVPQFPGLYPMLTVRACLERIGLWVAATGDPRSRPDPASALRRWALEGVADQPVRSLHQGLRRRLAFASAWLRGCPVVLLDEPTAALDTEERAEFWRLIGQWRSEPGGPALILVTTHLMAEAEQFCDEALVLGAGQSWFAGSVETLRKRAEGRTVTVRPDTLEVWQEQARERKGDGFRVTGLAGGRLRVLLRRDAALPTLAGIDPCPPALLEGYLALEEETFAGPEGPQGRQPARPWEGPSSGPTGRGTP